MFLLILCLDAPFYSIILISGNMDWTLKIESSGVSWSVLCHFTVCRYNVCLSAKQLGLEGFCYSACREGDRWGQWMGEVRTARAAREGGRSKRSGREKLRVCSHYFLILCWVWKFCSFAAIVQPCIRSVSRLFFRPSYHFLPSMSKPVFEHSWEVLDALVTERLLVLAYFSRSKSSPLQSSSQPNQKEKKNVLPQSEKKIKKGRKSKYL